MHSGLDDHPLWQLAGVDIALGAAARWNMLMKLIVTIPGL